ncbi:hypothetical protein RJ640_005591 [Escallonia rubra]|uniref:ATPase AAA-type core domain-containing protein n=1 Tax=Escallonia rubra TaxID=112253 RepID=A0AA88UGY9_9ASTE|nr:hypothetical protein RJ640_005591 [Escallonia rubra]
MGGNNQALDITAEAILQCIDEPQHMPLQPAKNSDADKHSLKLPEVIRMRPYCILLVDEVEKAHVSSFSTLISVLDHGMLRDGDGRVFDFTNTIVVIMSRLGNKEMLCKLVGYTRGVFVQDDGAKEGERHFRNELLNRVVKILLANPYAQEQLIKVARLSTRDPIHINPTRKPEFPHESPTRLGRRFLRRCGPYYEGKRRGEVKKECQEEDRNVENSIEPFPEQAGTFIREESEWP